MKAIYAVAGLAVLGLGLAGWAALARGQSGQDKAAADAEKTVVSPRDAASAPSPLELPPPSPQLNDVVITRTPTPPPSATPPPAVTPPPSATPPPPVVVSSPPKSEVMRPQGPILEERPPPAPSPLKEGITDRPEPAIALEWLGAAALRLRQPADYKLVVRNPSATPAQDVQVHVRVPNGLAVISAEPKAVAENRTLGWDLGTLPPRQERTLHVRFVAEASGELVAQAWATHTCLAALRLHVPDPKLVLKVQAPDQTALGDAAHLVFTLTNAGDAPAEQVKIQANLPDGLEHASGKHIELKVGRLAPGESRTATLDCTPKTDGPHACEIFAASDGGTIVREQVTIKAVASRLTVQASGPGLRYVDRKALYTIRVHNPGSAPAPNVMLSDVMPEGLKFLAASDGGQHDAPARQVSWRLGEIGPGQTKEVRLEVAPRAAGEHRQHLVAQAALGPKAEAEVKTRAEGVAALVTEVVDTDDPIEVGAETTYEVRIINTGSKDDTSVRLACAIPDKMEFRTAQAPCRYRVEGKNLFFDPLARLSPRGDAVYRITVRGVAPGDVRFQIQVSSANLTEPILRTESTRIYADAP